MSLSVSKPGNTFTELTLLQWITEMIWNFSAATLSSWPGSGMGRFLYTSGKVPLFLDCQFISFFWCRFEKSKGSAANQELFFFKKGVIEL